MSKKECIKCGAIIDKEVKFCSNCGASNFYEYDNAQETNSGDTELLIDVHALQTNNHNEHSEYAKIFGTSKQTSAAGNQKKKKTKRILLLIIGFIIISNIIFGVFVLSDDSSATTDDVDNAPTQVAIAYTKGGIVNGWYENEWADLKFQITESWPEGSIEDYNLFEDDATDCGFISNSDLKQFIIAYEDLAFNVNESQYLEALLDSCKESYDESDLNVTVSDVFDTVIGDKSFKTVKLTLGNDILHQYLCVYKKENHMIFISVTSPDDSEARFTLSSITRMSE